jgi:hypothetical protein
MSKSSEKVDERNIVPHFEHCRSSAFRTNAGGLILQRRNIKSATARADCLDAL